MKSNQNVQIRQTDLLHPGTQGFYGQQGGYPYPGLEDPFFGGGGHQYPVPYQAPQPPATTGGGLFGGTGTGGAGGAGGGSSFNLNQIKGFVDKMGGIDGIVGTMTRVQKMVASFQQMAPMIKLLLGSFGGAKASANSLGNFDSDSYKPRRRTKKGKRKLKKYRTKSGKTWTPKSRKRR